MRETKFIEQNREKWQDFEQMLQEDRHEPENLNARFVQITDDLSYARTFYPNRSVRIYLNQLAQQIFHRVYRGKRLPISRIFRFWSDELPQIMWEERRALWLAFALFGIALGIGIVSSILNPEFARIILGDQYINMTLENIQSGDPMAVYKQSRPLGMTLGIAINNLQVAVFTAISGVLAGIGTIYILLYNGIMVGAFQYFFIEKGVIWNSILTIWVHGTLEIGAIVISGAAGLVAGSGLLFPGTYRRAQAFQQSLRRSIHIFLGIAPLIVLAAIFEGYLTRFTETPAFIRACFIGVSLAFLIWYFVLYPWQKAHSSGFSIPDGFKTLPPDVVQHIEFHSIKPSGAIFADAFAIFSKKSSQLIGIIAGLGAFTCAYIAVFTLLYTQKFQLNPGKDWDGGDQVLQLFSGDTAPGLWYLQWTIYAVLSAVALYSVASCMPKPPKPGWANLLGLILPAMGMLLLAESGIGISAWFVNALFWPALGMISAAVFFGSDKLFFNLARGIQFIYWGPAILLGMLTVSTIALLFVFLKTPIWDTMLGFIGWIIPNGIELKIWIKAYVLIFFMYINVVFQVISGALFYFSCLETRTAASLHAAIEHIGKTRKIRGLPRE